MKIRFKLHDDSGKKIRDHEFTFQPGTALQHAITVFDSLLTLARYHPGSGKEIDGTTPTIKPKTAHCPTRLPAHMRTTGQDTCTCPDETHD